MTVWSVLVEGPGEPSDERLADLAEHVARWHGVASGGGGRIAARLTVDSDTPAGAVAGAVEAVREWIVEPDTLEVATMKRLDERNAHPPVELVGVAEVAELLGVARQRVSELGRTGRLPAPAARLAAGPVWERPAVERFAAEWRRRPGRPRSEGQGR